MITLTHHINYQYGQVIKVKPISDFHLGNAHCDEKSARKFLDEDPECWLFGLGDLMDMIVASDAKRYRKSSDGTDGDDIIGEQVERLAGWLEPHRDRIIGLGTGNHEDVITQRHSVNPTKLLCKQLNVPFLGYSFLLRINLSEDGGRGRNVIIRGHHGFGGARTQGGSITTYSRDMSFYDADIYAYGHVHRKQIDRVPRLGLVGDKLVAKPRLLILAGTFLKTFSNDHNPTYSERAGYPPSEIGGVTIHIKPTSSSVEYWADL